MAVIAIKLVLGKLMHTSGILFSVKENIINNSKIKKKELNHILESSLLANSDQLETTCIHLQRIKGKMCKTGGLKTAPPSGQVLDLNC